MKFVVVQDEETKMWKASALTPNGVTVCVREGKTRELAKNHVMSEIYRKEQLAFIRSAERQGFTVRHDYSGRFMYGDTCPAVVCKSGEFGFKGARTDSMGLDIVVYMP